MLVLNPAKEHATVQPSPSRRAASWQLILLLAVYINPCGALGGAMGSISAALIIIAAGYLYRNIKGGN